MLPASRCGACCVGGRHNPAPPTGRRRRAIPEPRLSVSRRSPRLRVVARRHHEVRPVGAAVRAAKPQARSAARHRAVDERLEVGVRLVAARVAKHQHARRSRCAARCALLAGHQSLGGGAWCLSKAQEAREDAACSPMTDFTFSRPRSCPPCPAASAVVAQPRDGRHSGGAVCRLPAAATHRSTTRHSYPRQLRGLKSSRSWGGLQQLLKLNVLNVGMLVTIHGLAMRIIWMSLKAKLHASTSSVAMKTGGNGRFLRECLPLRLQFSRRLRQFRGVTTGQAGFRAQGCIFQFD